MKVLKTMRAATVDGRGVVSIRELPVPSVGRREVLIAVDTAGVGSWDASMRPDSDDPLVPGIDGAGTVVAVGSRVRRFRVGDRVYSYSYENRKGGFHAEYVAVDAKKVARVPRGLDMKGAGAIATTGLTALQGVDDALHVKKGERMIVHGASGGVGSLALQFAKLRGARVLATASGRDGLALVRRLGADAAVDGKRNDIRAAARHFVPDGVDAVLAFAGGKPLLRCLDALTLGGRLAYPNGVEPVPRKRRRVKTTAYDGTPGVREFERLNRAIEEAKLKVPIAKTYSLARAGAAYDFVEEGHVVGKVVIRIR
ncbi:MAG TPA: NADP-dependent oxidoreductase [Thermoanaerobaculia bacterium]|jgi:NADPH:quinone reductase-like Zn-dependent oxidoreductase|nr:NADP-dependent oxidoreductase [Thermoanaerobaculia bacterium]